MNISEIYRNTFENDFNLVLPEIKQGVLEYIKNNPTSISINSDIDYLQNILNREKDPNYVPEFLSFTNEGISLGMFNDEIVEFIINNLPETLESLTIPAEIIENNPTCLKRLTNLKELGIPNYGWQLTIDEYKSFVEGLNVKVINSPNIKIEDAENIKKYNYISDSSFMNILIDNISVVCRPAEFDSIVNLITPISEEGLSLIPKDLFNEDNTFFEIRVDGKRVIKKYKENIDVLLSDNIEETKDLMMNLLSRITNKPESITLIGQNKTYPNISELKFLEDVCKVEIEYGYNAKASIDQFDAMRGTLDYYKSLILQNDLSPAERICYAYDLIKSNIYRENEAKKSDAREIHSIVETGNIVCVGYSVFLAQLLKEVGIKAHTISTSVPRDDGTKAGHQRNLIDVEDEKYGISGIYAFDCTWDSNSDAFKVIRDGEEIAVRKTEPGDEIIKQYDPMSRYTYFFIPASEYGLYFPGEKQFEKISDWYGVEYNPNEKGLSELPKRSSNSNESEDVFTTVDEVQEDKIMDIIFNTRICEGYSLEVNQQLLEEIDELRKIRGPKELRAEEGMTR